MQDRRIRHSYRDDSPKVGISSGEAAAGLLARGYAVALRL